MPSKSKKTRASGRFGARYGRRVRDKFADVESKQRVKQKCPFCSKLGVKRKAKGIKTKMYRTPASIANHKKWNRAYRDIGLAMRRWF